jgi:para-nitrobenzyl esterase
VVVLPRYTRASDTIMDFTGEGKAVASRDPWGQQIEQAEQALARAKAPGHYATLTKPIGKRLYDPDAKAIMDKRTPELIGMPQIGMARGFPLAALLSSPSHRNPQPWL